MATSNDRSSNSLRNARYGMLFFSFSLLVSFLYRRYFIDVLGDELLGLNSTLVSILGFLNVAELGLVSAIAFALYEPLAKNDRHSIREIVSIQAWLYRIIAICIGVGATLLLPFFPLIFKDITLPLWYAYATYAVLLLNALWSYLFNFRQVVFSSDQKEYKATLSRQLPRLVKLLLQILAICYLSNPYLWWLIWEFIGGLVEVVLLEWLIRREYPWLKANARLGHQVYRHYPDILHRTKQLIIHKLSSFVLYQSSPLILFALFSTASGLVMVAVYQNYLLLYSGIIGITTAAFSGLTASVGNLITEQDHSKVERVFSILYALRLWIVMIIVVAFFWYSHSFISLWIGEERTFGTIERLLFSLFILLQITRQVDQFISAYGFFQDIYAPLIELSLNLVLSILFGYLWGIKGLLLGINISLIVVVHGWKPYFLYSRGFGKSVMQYHLNQAATLLVCLIVALLMFYALPGIVVIKNAPTWFEWMLYTTLGTSLYAFLSGGILYLINRNYKVAVQMLVKRLYRR